MRIPVSAPQNKWFNGQNIDDADLLTEQSYNNQIQTGIINNHFGSGVVPDVLSQKQLFDSLLVSGVLDGKGIDFQNQPRDQNQGSQLEVELSGSLATGKRTVKVLIIGLNFENTLQYDRFVFHTNEKQFSKNHYVRVLKVFFNDFIGDANLSFNLGGRIVIKETNPLTISRDSLMLAQDVEPNLFFRDFFVSGGGSLSSMLQQALPSYNLDTLNIKTGYRQLRELAENDVVSQIGQKFLASNSNIQKITLLMSVDNSSNPADLVWNGDLIVSLYPLQSVLDCPVEISPTLAIDFPPSNIPLAQLSFNYNSLADRGVVLDTVPQPVDFIFSNTAVGAGTAISADKYYVITVKRAGSANKCSIKFAVGENIFSESRLTLFDGNDWVDVSEESLWFQVWSDAVKISDGQAYDAGVGVSVPKVKLDNNTGVNIDYCLDNVSFVRNDVYYAHLSAVENTSVPVQDARTGNTIDSIKQYEPSLSLIKDSELLKLTQTSDPLILGTVSDKNVKSYNALSAAISAYLREYCIVKNELLIKIIDDPTDPRYDLDVLNLVTEFLNGNLNNAKFIPNISNPTNFYRICRSELISLTYGDLNDDGVVDENDLAIAQNLLGVNLTSVPTQQDYISLTNYFVDDGPLTFQVLDGVNVVASGTDGILTVNVLDGTLANFASASTNFSALSNLSTLKVHIPTAINPKNIGSFSITALLDPNNITIKKLYYSPEVILQAYKADINGDMIVSSVDTSLLTDYIYKNPPFPATSSPANKIGTKFNVLKLTLEQFTDRDDDYSSSINNRSSLIHIVPDILADGYNLGFSLYGQDLLTSPVAFNIVKQLSWNDYYITTSPNVRMVPVAFTYQSGHNINTCNVSGKSSDIYPFIEAFDPGKNDFFIPNNLVMNLGGEILRSDGYFYKVDFEVGQITLELPASAIVEEKYINLFADFICNQDGNGKTRLGYNSMKFADCSVVESDALLKDQVRISVSLQSNSPLLDGYYCDNMSGPIVDGRMGIYLDHQTGLLYLNFANLFDDFTLQTLSTKLNITVYLKKAGWNNKPLFVSASKTQNILELTPETFNCGNDTLIILT